MTFTASDLAAAIRAERAARIAVGVHPLAINNGDCEDFANAVARRLGGRHDDFAVLGSDNLCLGEGEPFDRDLIATYYPTTVPPAPLTWDDVDGLGVADDLHVWLMLDGRHHDSDAPEGVDNLFDLPLYRRNIVCAMQERRPAALASLVAAEPWWRESAALHEAYRTWVDAGEPVAETEEAAVALRR